MASAEKIQAEVDRLAVLSTEGWDHNGHYHAFLLRHVPAQCDQALEIGCGTGSFARSLAPRAQHILALDLSPRMIRLARERSTGFINIWNFTLRLWKQHRLRPPREVRAAWAEHGRTDIYPALAQVRPSCQTHLPNAHVTRHLLWRYSIVWQKPV